MLTSFASRIRAQKRLLKTIAGGVLLLYSKHLTYSLLFLQSFRSTGWPIMKQGAEELGHNYRAARAAFKEQLPTILKSRELLPQVVREMEEARSLAAETTAYVKELNVEKQVVEARLKRAARTIEESLPSKRELEAAAAEVTRGLPSKSELEGSMRRARGLSERVQKKLAAAQAAEAAAESDNQKLQAAKAMLTSLAEEEKEAKAAMAEAVEMKGKYEAALVKAKAEAQKALPNAKELQSAMDDAAWARDKALKHLATAEGKKEKALSVYHSAMETYTEATKVGNSLAAVSDAIDPEKVRVIARGVATGAMTCVAAATSPLAGTATIGADVGAMISAKVLPLLTSATAAAQSRLSSLPVASVQVPGPVTKWADASLGAACTGVGILVAFKTKQLVLLCSGALIGARMVTQSVSQQVEAMTGWGLDKIPISAVQRRLDLLDGSADGATFGGIKTDSLDASAIAETLLAGAAIATQLTIGGEIPAAMKVLMGPVLALEAYLKTAAAVAEAKAKKTP